MNKPKFQYGVLPKSTTHSPRREFDVLSEYAQTYEALHDDLVGTVRLPTRDMTDDDLDTLCIKQGEL